MDQMLSVLYPTNSVKALNELQDTVIRIDRNQEKLSLAHPFFTLHWRLVLTFKGSYYLYEGCSTPVFFNVCSQHTSTELDLSVNSRIKIRVFRTDLAATVQVLLQPIKFIPALNLPFQQILPTVAFLFFFRADYMDFPDCLPLLLSISIFFTF